MLKSRSRWQIKENNQQELEQFSELDVHPIIGRLLAQRGLSDKQEIEQFFNPNEVQFYDPFLLNGMEKAVKRIHTSILKKEKILVYGDYDADGVTSTSILYKTLKKLGADFSYYIPNRFTEGYGLNSEAIIEAKKRNYKLIITVDTGISAVEEAALANALDICLIITDHHEPPMTLPEAFAVINPKKPNDNYPFKYLAGVGVAFKLAHALLGKIPTDLLDLAAIGTIADLVPLSGENRVIAGLGLKAITNTSNIGLRTLLEDTGLDEKELTAGHIGFILAPRVNASGRLNTAKIGVKLFTTEHKEEALAFVQQMNEINKERQSLVETITKEAIKIVESNKMEQEKVIVIGQRDWNEGVIGIVASRMVEKYYRPTIVMNIDPETKIAKGSARSIEGFNIHQALSTLEEMFLSFGGHPMAAGLSLQEENIPELRKKLNEVADQLMAEEDFTPLEKVDLVCDMRDIDIDLIKEIEKMQPFGIGNPSPKFLLKDAQVHHVMTLGKEKNHLKINLTDQERHLEAIAFGKGDLLKDIAHYSNIQVLGELSINEWMGKVKPQIILKDMHIEEIQVFDWRKADLLEMVQTLDVTYTAIMHKQENEQILKLKKDNWLAIHYNQHQGFTDISSVKNLVLYHIPPSIENIRIILRNYSDVERIYCIFEELEQGRTVNSINRSLFKKVYVELKQKKFLKSKEKAEIYFKNAGLTSEVIKIILDVFVELGFIIIKGDDIIMNTNPEKRDLSESQLYQSVSEPEELKELFLNTNHQMLRKWFLDSLSNVK